ncbi:MAG TPA: ATP-dependent Clp protease adaptor ClpS, partial [archaeon]|nr:ATP-dependent Clp protease adaptor ClpS [archaeon]
RKASGWAMRPAGGVRAAPPPRAAWEGGYQLLEATYAFALPGRAAPEEIADLEVGGDGGSKVFLFNCDCHSFEEVIVQLLKAVPGMTRPLAEELAWRAHTQGLAEVYRGSASECDRVAKILGETGLIVQVL